MHRMVKTLLCLLLLALAGAGALADEAAMPALTAIEKFGSIAIDDGRSYFAFSKDGSFRSGPLGMSGRSFEGRWTTDGGKLTAVAMAGWMNGLSRTNDRRRIVFVIGDVRKRPPQNGPRQHAPVELFDGYFYIDELVSLPAEPIRPRAASTP